MRSTKASAAIDRLKRRSNNPLYSMSMSSTGLFCLQLGDGLGNSTRLCEPMAMDDFVAWVNGYGPQTVRRVSKLDLAFSKQLQKKTT
jgi:hypothetical protein